MTVRLAWSEIWLSLFNEMDSPTKTKFLRDSNLVRLVQTVTDEVQIEILEHAPAILVNHLQEHLRPKAKEVLLGKPQSNAKYLNIVKRIRGQ